MESRGKLCMKIQVWETKKSFSIFSMLYICSIIFLLFTDSSGFLRLFLGRSKRFSLFEIFLSYLVLFGLFLARAIYHAKPIFHGVGRYLPIVNFEDKICIPAGVMSIEIWGMKIKVGGNEKKVLCSFVIIVFLWIFLACFRLFRIV